MQRNENEIIEYTIKYKKYQLKVLNIGAVITEYSYNNQNIVLAYSDRRDYLKNEIYLGAIVGRSAGRIRGGIIPGSKLPLNQDGKHNLHGNDMHLKFYDVLVKNNKIILTLNDLEGPFPGDAEIKVTYELTDDGLVQHIMAFSDKPTIFNMTNHSYFNLNTSGDILSHQLQINADYILELDHDLLPIGKISPKETAFDFSTPKLIKEAQNQQHQQFKYSKFIDHPYHLTGNVVLCGDLLKLEIQTDQRFLVVYCGNYIGDETKLITNDMNYDYCAICLEAQQAPNTTTLMTEYNTTTYYKLSEM